MYMSNSFQTYFTFFFLFLFFLRLFDNVSAIRFILSLVKYHNCFITIFLTEKTGKTYRYKHYLQSRHATPFLLWKKKLTRTGLYSKSIIKRIDKSYIYLLRDTVVHHVALGDVDERTLLVFLLLHCSFYPLQVLSVLCLLFVVPLLSRSLRGRLCAHGRLL